MSLITLALAISLLTSAPAVTDKIETALQDVDIDELSDIALQAEWNYYNSFEVESDPWLLAHLITGEAQNCDDREQQWVASVGLNRVKSPKFPNTLVGVIYDPGQYACVNDGNFYRQPTLQNWRNAMYIYRHGSVLPDEVVWQSNCTQGAGVYATTNYHVYCYS